jgi:hypothetical protein
MDRGTTERIGEFWFIVLKTKDDRKNRIRKRIERMQLRNFVSASDLNVHSSKHDQPYQRNGCNIKGSRFCVPIQSSVIFNALLNVDVILYSGK